MSGWSQRVVGGAGIGYAVGVGVENMDLLTAPRLGSAAPDIRAAFANSGQVLVGAVAGGIGLVLFVVFVLGLYRRVSGCGRWAVAGLVGGLLAPALAGVGIVTDVVLLARITGLPDVAVVQLFAVHPRLQLLAGPFIALFLIGIGTAGLRTGALHPWPARAARLIGLPLAATPLALLAADGPAPAAATVGFVLFSVWGFLTSLWLVLAGPIPEVVFVRRAVFLVLAVAAGLVGVVLLVVPAATATFFSWGLAPPALAAFAGGAYLGSAVVYAAALARPLAEVRGLVVGVAVLSSSVLVVTLTHLAQFDFMRLQAWAWLVLFSVFTVLSVGLLVVERGEGTAAPGEAPPRWVRAVLAAAAGGLAALAIGLWTAPTAMSTVSPVGLPPLGGRFAGSWFALLAALAGWAAWRNTVAAARFPALALVALPAGMVLAALRTADQLQPAAGYLTFLVLVLVAGGVAARAVQQARHGERPSSSPAGPAGRPEPRFTPEPTPARDGSPAGPGPAPLRPPKPQRR